VAEAVPLLSIADEVVVSSSSKEELSIVNSLGLVLKAQFLNLLYSVQRRFNGFSLAINGMNVK
jgi:hypothetical protein